MKTGYELSFDDFRSLLSDSAWRGEFVPLLRRWLDCEVVPQGGGFILRDGSGREVSPQVIYEAIQKDPGWQYDFYQKAMSLWR